MSKPIPCQAGTDQSGTSQTSCNTCAGGTYSNIPGTVNCQTLPAGFYANPEKSASIPCPKGTHTNAAGTGCDVCTAGSLCGIGEAVAAPAHSGCQVGFYCPVDGSQVVQTPCPAGKYGHADGADTEANGCTDCPIGYFCPGGPAVPLSCPEGAYCELGTATPTLCPIGTYNERKAKGALGDCNTCLGGELCPMGTISPLDCPSGSFCGAGDTTPTTCNPGSYLPLNNVPDSRTTTQADCLACPLGHYCLIGSSNPTPCPVGTYRDSLSGTADTDCADCPVGKACPFEGITDVNTAVACDYGHYCPAKSSYPQGLPCAAGKFSDNTDNTLATDCVDCAAGYYCSAGANTFTNPPVECPEGYYCPAGSLSGTTNPCPGGSYSSNTGLTANTECTACPAGSYCSAGSVAVTGLCSAGYWCPISSTLPTENSCPAGTFSAGTGLKTENECTVCTLGYTCDAAALTAPVKCPAGTYGSKAGLDGTASNECTTCTMGSYCAEGVTEPTVCGKGMYSAAGAMDAGSPICEKCPTGHYCAYEATAPFATGGSTDALACGAGFICDIAGLVGVPEVPYHPTYSCPAGYYCLAGATVGTACATGTYNPSSGKEDPSSCLAVPAGYYADVEATTSIATNECPAGYYCLASAATSTANPCAAGTYRSLVGGQSPADCAACPTGYYCGENTVTPIECPQGYYCVINTIDPVKCPEGYYGADSRLRALVDCTICPQGRYCSQAGLSEPDGLCDAGYTCGSGSTTPAPPLRRNLAGVSGVCPAGGYCEQGSKYSTRCPPGTYNNVEGKTSAADCLACVDGEFCIGTTDPNTSGTCSAGYYCHSSSTAPTQFYADQGKYAAAGDALDTVCAVGTYNPFFAQSACLPCKVGYYCQTTGLKVMTPCPIGQYCPAGASTTTDCLAGTYNSITKAQAAADCIDCPPGMYCLAGASTPTADCTQGHYCRLGAEIAAPTGSVTNYGQCPAGHYCPTATGDPIQCPPGTYNPSTGSIDNTACAQCPAGRYCELPGLSTKWR